MAANARPDVPVSYPRTALGRAFRERVVAYRVSEMRRLVERGIERGDLRRDTDVDLLHEALFGPVYYRLPLSGGALDRNLATRIVDTVLPSFAAPGG